jgi:hypothetical protein
MRSKVTLFCALLMGMAIAVFAGCNRTAAVEDWSSALVELRDEGTVAWNIRADGTVKAMVKGRDEKPITANVTGKIATDDGSVELKQSEGSGVLEGKGMKLGAELTRAKYDLVVDGKTWSGTLFVPAGGTADFVAGAKAVAAVKLPDAKIGPHGGTLQIVGGDVLELVVNASTGELRVYPFDAQLKAIAAADRAIKVGVITDSKAELVALLPDPSGAYFTGKIGISVDPVEVAISVKGKAQAEAQCVLVGFQPGVALAINATAPRVKILVKADAPSAEGDVNARADMKGGAAVGGNLKSGVDVKVPDLKAPDVKLKGAVNAPAVDAKAGANAGAGAKAGVGLNAGVAAGAKAGAGTDTKATNTDTKTTKAGGKLQVKLP